MKKLLTIQFILMLFMMVVPFTTLAEGIILDPTLKPLYATDIKVSEEGNRASLANAVLQMIAGGLIYLAGPIAVLILVTGGIRYIVSRGDQTQMEEAKKTITWAVIGLMVIILSWAIITNVMWVALHGGTLGTDKEADYVTLPVPEKSQESGNAGKTKSEEAPAANEDLDTHSTAAAGLAPPVE